MDKKENELNKMNIKRFSGEEANKISKECLHIALIYLLSEKEYNKISITELVKRAGVSRATFYRNYNSKEEIIIEIIENLSQNAEVLLSDYKSDPYNMYLAVFNKISEYKDIFYAMFSAKLSLDSTLSFLNAFERTNSSSNIEAHYRSIAFEGAFVNIVKDWILNDMSRSPQEMAKICTNILQYDI